MIATLREKMDKDLSVARSDDYVQRSDIAGIWAFYIGGREREAAEVDTGVKQERLAELLEKHGPGARRFPSPSEDRAVARSAA